MKRMHEVLMDLCSTIDAAGGLVRDDDGHLVPAGDEDWLDLASVYLDACRVLGREPIVDADAERSWCDKLVESRFREWLDRIDAGLRQYDATFGLGERWDASDDEYVLNANIDKLELGHVACTYMSEQAREGHGDGVSVMIAVEGPRGPRLNVGNLTPKCWVSMDDLPQRLDETDRQLDDFITEIAAWIRR